MENIERVGDPMRKLRKSNDDAILFGVLAGFAEYFEVDTTLVRVIFIVLSFSALDAFIILYALLAFFMPKEPEEVTREKRRKSRSKRKVSFEDLFSNNQAKTRRQAEDVEVIDEDDWSDF